VICVDFSQIFPNSTRWLPWYLFEQEVASSDDLAPFEEKRKNTLAGLEIIAKLHGKPLDLLIAENEKRPDYEPYFYRPRDKSAYEVGTFSSSIYSDSEITYEDKALRMSILYRARRRRFMGGGSAMSDADVKELFDLESREAADSFAWTEISASEDSYDEWEGFVYTHAQQLVDGYFGTGFRNCIEEMRLPSAAAYNNWAYDLLKCGWYSDALGILQEALKLDFECTYVWHTMSQTYAALGMSDKACWALDEYSKLVGR
jgi:tetratricopeptide (TPR) repeat protein